MLYKSIQFAGLRIVIDPEKKLRDSVGNPVKTGGKSIHFVNSEYRTGKRQDICEDDEIAFIRGYMKKWPGELEEVDEVQIARKRAAYAEADKKLAEEDKLKTRPAVREDRVPENNIPDDIFPEEKKPVQQNKVKQFKQKNNPKQV
jgi:hypothetical protein